MARPYWIVVALGLLLGPSALPQEVEEFRTRIDKKLARAFPGDERVLNMFYKLDIRSKGLTFAANEFSIEPDGRLKLLPCRMAWFDTKRADKKLSDKVLQRFRSEFVFIELDAPVKNFVELATRKIVALELASGDRFAIKN